MCGKNVCAGVLFFFGVLMFALIAVGEMVLPGMIYDGVKEGLPYKSQSDVEKDIEDPTVTQSTFTIFNLTNAYALQTATVTPKPHFVPIEIQIEETEYKYDPVYDAATGSYKYSSYSTYRPLNEADLNLEIVQFNPVYLGAFHLFPVPSEKIFYGGFSNTVLGSVNTALVGFGAQMVAASGGACTDAADCAALQFATSALSNAALSQASMAQGGPAVTGSSISMIPTIQALGVCTPVEIVRFMNDATATTNNYYPFAAGSSLYFMLAAQGLSNPTFTMTKAQGAAFLNMFMQSLTPTATNPATNYALVMYALAYQGWATQMLTAQTQQAVATTAATNGDTATAATAVAAATAAQTAAAAYTTQINTVFSTTFGTLSATRTSGAVIEVCGATNTDMCPVLANAYLMYLIQYLGDDFFTGCTLVGQMQPDGVGALNSGLFTRHTVGEFFHGYEDALFLRVPAALVPADKVPLEFNGLLGHFARGNTTLAEVRSSFVGYAARAGPPAIYNTENQTEWTNEYDGGSNNLDDLGKWVRRQGVPGEYTGWDDTGRPSTSEATGAHYAIAGRHSQGQQPMTTKKPSAVSMFLNGMEDTVFSGGSSLSFFLGTIRREVTISTDGTYYDVEGVKALKFKSTDTTLAVTKNGLPFNASGAGGCGGTSSLMQATFAGSPVGTAPTCDWIMRHEGVVNLEVPRAAPMGVTHAFFGKTTPEIRDAVSITAAGGGAELMYDEQQHELALYFEPITGKAIAGYERLQLNLYVAKNMFDAKRYESIFGASTDLDDTLLVPFLLLNRNPQLTSSQADIFKAIYMMYTIGAWLVIAGAVLGPTLICVGCCVLRSAGKKNSGVEV